MGSRVAERYIREHELFTPTRRELDITDRGSVETCLKSILPDAVIHCAAVSDVGACEREPEASYLINVTGCENIAAVSRELGAKCVLCSSDQVYFGSPAPHREDQPLEPGNVYGRQKLEMEERCLRVDPDCVLLRLAWMYDSVKREKEHGSFLYTLREDLRAGRDLSFPVYDMRGITDVSEVVENMGRALHLPGGVYNFGSGNDKSTYETMGDVFDRLGYTGPSRLLKNTAAFADRPRDLCMDPEKAQSMGIYFSTTADGLTRALEPLLRQMGTND